MEFNDFLNLSLAVLRDWRVIIITLIAIIFIALGNYVVRYKKRPPKIKKKFSISSKAKSANPSATKQNNAANSSISTSSSASTNSSSEDDENSDSSETQSNN